MEFMDREVHLVDGNRNYIRLLGADVDYYSCCECDELVEVRVVETVETKK